MWFFLNKKNNKSEYIVAIIFGLIALYIVNNLLNWHIYFITPALNQILWIINLSIVITIIGNAILLIFNPEWFRHLVKIIINIFSLISAYFVYIVFPFNFYNSFLNWGFSIFLLLVIVGIVIAIIVELYYLINSRGVE